MTHEVIEPTPGTTGTAPATDITRAVTSSVSTGEHIDVVRFLCWALLLEIVALSLLGGLALWFQPEGGAYAIATEVMQAFITILGLNFTAVATIARPRS